MGLQDLFSKYSQISSLVDILINRSLIAWTESN